MDIYQNAAQIHHRIQSLGQQVNTHYAQYGLTPEAPLHLIGLLNGAFMFMADLSRQLTVPCQLHFIRVSSYEEHRESNGNPEVDWLGKQASEFIQQHLLLVDDILDTGQSLQTVMKQLHSFSLKSLELAVLVDKPAGRGAKPLVPELQARFSGFTLTGHASERFVVGYGLDDAGRYRELPYLGLL